MTTPTGGLFNQGRMLGRDAASIEPVLDVLALDGIAKVGSHCGLVAIPASSQGLMNGGQVGHRLRAAGEGNIYCHSERKQDCAQVIAKSFAMKPLAEAVREHRLHLGMNPAQYARHVGTSRQNINNVEAGDAKHPRYIGKLAKAMGASVDALLAGQVGPWKAAASTVAQELIDAGADAPPRPRALPEPARSFTTDRGRPVGSIVVGAVGIRASMGLGADRPSHDEVVAEMVIDERWLRRNCTFTSPENLSLVTGVGDSMRPTFEDGDALLVDRGVREARVDGIYALSLNDELYIKRVQRRPDGTLMMISDNRSYEPYQIAGGRDRLDVLGRVVMSWCAQRL